jgi:hypothetical protein
MLAEADATALHRRWHRVLVGVHAGLAVHGVDNREAYVSGSPLRLQIGSSCDVQLIEGPGEPRAVIRAQQPGNGIFVAALDTTDSSAAADILDCIGCVIWRRRRLVDADHAAAEAEMLDMVASTGWECGGVGGRQPTATFHSADDRVRGRLVRADRDDGDPAQATFSVTVETSGLAYAESLSALASLSRVLGGENHPPRGAARGTNRRVENELDRSYFTAEDLSWSF